MTANPALMIREAEAELKALWTLKVTSVLGETLRMSVVT
jgi:hypothetical protein